MHSLALRSAEPLVPDVVVHPPQATRITGF